MSRKRTDPAAKGDRGLAAERKRLHALGERDLEKAALNDPLNPPLGEEELEAMELAFPATKQLISLRIDRPVIDWFKEQGPRYQTRMNAVLRGYVREVQRRQGRNPATSKPFVLPAEKAARPARRRDLRREEKA